MRLQRGTISWPSKTTALLVQLVVFGRPDLTFPGWNVVSARSTRQNIIDVNNFISSLHGRHCHNPFCPSQYSIPVAVLSNRRLPQVQTQASHLCTKGMEELLWAISGVNYSDGYENLAVVLEQALSVASIEVSRCQFCPKAHEIIR